MRVMQDSGNSRKTNHKTLCADYHIYKPKSITYLHSEQFYYQHVLLMIVSSLVSHTAATLHGNSIIN